MADQDVFLERALLEFGHLAEDQIESVRRYGVEHGVDLVDALVATETIDGRSLALVRAEVCEVPFVDLSAYEANFTNTRLIPRAVADRYRVFPLFLIDGTLTLAMDDPLNLEAMDHARQVSKCDVDVVLVERDHLNDLISRAYSLHSADSLVTETVAEDDLGSENLENAAPIVAAVNQLLADAVEQGASDVHVNPDEGALRLRYRIDGVLHEMQGPPLSMHAGIAQRLKVMANLDLTQTRRPQDGKFRFRHQDGRVDVRMSTVPTVCGENVVLRLLASSQRIHDFGELGVPSRVVEEVDAILAHPYGMMLVTGPTGSGKTTTLYSALNKVNNPSCNIMTIEDPVEIRLPYVRQIQVHNEIGFTFASALRSILRQDPDIVLVGEIRDEETAMIALQAALTGHMVLSTLHTNDAVGAVARLRDFGLPSFVINSAVLGVIAQRLVRRVCDHCTTPDEPTDMMRMRFRLEQQVSGFRRGAGCARCGQTGYRGRVGIYELLQFSSAVQRTIEQGGTVDQVREIACSDGMRLMWQDGLEKARLGQTTLEEVAKVAAMVGVCESPDEMRSVA